MGNGLILEIRPGTHEMLLLNAAKTRWSQNWPQMQEFISALKIQKIWQNFNFIRKLCKLTFDFTYWSNYRCPHFQLWFLILIPTPRARLKRWFKVAQFPALTPAAGNGPRAPGAFFWNLRSLVLTFAQIHIHTSLKVKIPQWHITNSHCPHAVSLIILYKRYCNAQLLCQPLHNGGI